MRSSPRSPAHLARARPAACSLVVVAFLMVGSPAAADEPSVAERLTSLVDRYHAAIDERPEEARRIRDEHAALVNSGSAEPPFFSFILGSQWLGGLSNDPPPGDFLRDRKPLHVAWSLMADAGSDIVKIEPDGRSLAKQVEGFTGREPLDEAVRHPHMRAVLDGPFRVALFWAHGGRDGWQSRELSHRERAELHRELYEFTRFLLRTYDGSGKTFLIGNWEGDWLAGAKSAGDDQDLALERIAAFQDWLDVRTRAIDAAKADTPHDGVRVFSYLEINHVDRARTKGLKRLVNTVLPRSRVDYVSVSSYEMQGYGRWKPPRTAEGLRRLVVDNLDYVESNLPPRDVPGRRVFIGEIGFTLEEIERRQGLTGVEADREQARLALIQASVDVEWGVPLWLWWAIYNSREGAFGLIDQATGRRSTLFRELETYFAWAEGFVTEHRQATGRLPPDAVFRGAALDQLRRQIAALEAPETPDRKPGATR